MCASEQKRARSNYRATEIARSKGGRPVTLSNNRLRNSSAKHHIHRVPIPRVMTSQQCGTYQAVAKPRAERETNHPGF